MLNDDEGGFITTIIVSKSLSVKGDIVEKHPGQWGSFSQEEQVTEISDFMFTTISQND